MNRWMLYEAVGKQLRQIRRTQGKEVSEVAKAVGTSQQVLSKIEAGEAPPPLHLVANLAKYYGVTMSEVVPLV